MNRNGKSTSSELDRILRDAGLADPHTGDRMLPLVYDELRKLAEHKLRQEPSGLTLQATALVHEAFIRLERTGDAVWENRGHFFGAAAEAMRRILIERARRIGRVKHGGGRHRLALEEVDPSAPPEFDDDVLALDEALSELEQVDPVRANVVKLRYFAGLTIEQTANVLQLSPATVSGHWTYARAWLFERIQDRRPSDSGDLVR